MIEPDVATWRLLGKTSNADIYEIEPHVLAIVPHQACVDNEATARESVEFQHAHWRATGRRGGALIYVDRITDQQSGARRVYTTLPDRALVACYALVGGSAFGRAIASVFLGLSRPAAPTRMFGSTEQAVEWVRGLASQPAS